MSEHTETGTTAASVLARIKWPSVETLRDVVRDDEFPDSEDDFGFRPRCNWGSGDLPAPFATGDLLWLPEPYEDPVMRPELGDPGWYVVVYSTSIDEGDGWYFRVESVDEPGPCSGRLHVLYAGRCDDDRESDLNRMKPFVLARTSDDEGLRERERLLAEGWTFERTHWQAPIVWCSVTDAYFATDCSVYDLPIHDCDDECEAVPLTVNRSLAATRKRRVSSFASGSRGGES